MSRERERERNRKICKDMSAFHKLGLSQCFIFLSSRKSNSISLTAFYWIVGQNKQTRKAIYLKGFATICLFSAHCLYDKRNRSSQYMGDRSEFQIASFLVFSIDPSEIKAPLENRLHHWIQLLQQDVLADCITIIDAIIYNICEIS